MFHTAQVVRDLRLGKYTRPSDRNVLDDASLWRRLLHTELFDEAGAAAPAAKGKAKAKPKAKRRRPKPPDRLAAQDYIRALDNSLQKCTGKGLSRFQCTEEEDVFGAHAPVLTLTIDQGSDGWAAVWWLCYSAMLRLVFVMDPFHREHNDVLDGVKAAGAWSCVLLSGMTHNINYGPWEGHAWFHKLLEGLQHYLSFADHHDPLFVALYELICGDLGIDLLTQAADGMEEVFNGFKNLGCFLKKGPRTAFRRWFSWFAAHSWHSQFWHSRLLVISYIGIRMGIYNDLSCIPLSSSSVSYSFKKDALPDGCEPEEDEDDGRTAEDANAAVRAEVAKDREGDPTADPDKVPVKSGNDMLKDLYKKCANSLHVCGSILGMECLQTKCNGIYAAGKPYYDSHSAHARDLRGPVPMMSYYGLQSRYAYLTDVAKSLGVLNDIEVLRVVGFDTESGGDSIDRSSGEAETDPHVLHQNDLAVFLVKVTLNMAHFRINSMSWHSECWPGLLGLLLCTDDMEAADDLFWNMLWKDYTGYLAVVEKSAKNTFFRTSVKSSPFRMVFMREFVDRAFSPRNLSRDQITAELRQIAKCVFSCILDTKPCEDMFKVLRDRETRDTPTKNLKLEKQVLVSSEAKILELHGRRVMEGSTFQSNINGFTPKDTFWPESSEPSIDIDSIVGPQSWPSLKPLGYCLVAAQLSLIRECCAANSWDTGSYVWQSVLFPVGTVFTDDAFPGVRVSLGTAVNFGFRSWPLDAFTDKTGGGQIYAVTQFVQTKVAYHHCTDLRRFYVMLTEVVSPARVGMMDLDGVAGAFIGWRLTGLPTKPLDHAASQCFWKLPKFILDKIARHLKVEKSVDEFKLLLNILSCIFPEKTDGELAAILAIRGLAESEPSLNDLPEGVVDDLVDKGDQIECKDCVHIEVLFTWNHVLISYQRRPQL